MFFKEKRSAEDINVFYYYKNSAASFLAPEDLNEEYIASAKILHITGITPALSETSKESVFAAINIAKKPRKGSNCFSRDVFRCTTTLYAVQFDSERELVSSITLITTLISIVRIMISLYIFGFRIGGLNEEI